MNPNFPYKVGFLGTGNLAQSMIKGLLEKKVLMPSQIMGSNRSAGKLNKLVEAFHIRAANTNEELLDFADVVVLCTKPQDLLPAIEPLASLFLPQHLVISIAAGITLHTLEKKLQSSRLVRAMPNTPSVIHRGVTGYMTNQKDPAVPAVVEDLLSPLGLVLQVDDEDQFEALSVSCAAGTGFVFELMTYWQDWIEERGFEPEVARQMTVETFLGAAMLAAHSSDTQIVDLINKVASKKGITEAGLESMRELEIERALRYSFEKSALRNRALAKED